MVRGKKNPAHFGLGDRVRRARIALGVSSAELARRAGFRSHSTPILIERGTHYPRIDHVERLAAALDVSAGFLAFGADPSIPKPPGGSVGFSGRLRSARTELGISMRELERASGLAVGVGRAAEAAKSIPTVRTVERIAVSIGVSPAWLAFGEGPRELVRRRWPSLDPLTVPGG